MRRGLVTAAVLGLLGGVWTCVPDAPGASVPGEGDAEGDTRTPDGGEPPSADGGGTPPPDTGDDGGAPPGPHSGPGPWPDEPIVDYTARYALGPVQSVGVDAAGHIWLLEGDRIGVLRAGTDRAVWTRGVGQAAGGFGTDRLATGSSVICGGEGGRAYVGYLTYELATLPYSCDTQDWWRRHFAWIAGPGEPCYSDARLAEFRKGDLDVVRLQADGTVALEEHLFRSAGTSNPASDPRSPLAHIGLRNSNDWHYDEDRMVLSCTRVMRGPFKGDVYVGTNHGVTRIQGLVYSSHRHPAWYEDEASQEGLRTAFTFGLGIAPNGDVLIATDEKLGILRPSASLRDFDKEMTWEGPAPWVYQGYNDRIPNGVDGDDLWRGIAQTPDGRTYVGSIERGLWRMDGPRRPDGTRGPWQADATFVELEGLPTRRVQALQATDDGSLFVGTADAGLWRLLPDGSTFQKVEDLRGGHVKQLLYDPTVTPPMLYILTDSALTVLRGR